MSWTWILTALSIVGTVLNIRKKRSGFVLWAFCNFAWALVDFEAGLASQAALFGAYFVLALWGWVSWTNDPPSHPSGKKRTRL